MITNTKIEQSRYASRTTRDVESSVRTAISRLGIQTRDMAKRLAPKRTGALAASIVVSDGISPAVDTGYSPFTRHSTIGYFRAINSLAMHSGNKPGVLSSIEQLGKLGGIRHEAPPHENEGATISETSRRLDAVFTLQATIAYAGDVEFGHVEGSGHVPPHPFFSPALAWTAAQLPLVLARAIEEGAKR
jgi:hypothetical protein